MSEVTVTPSVGTVVAPTNTPQQQQQQQQPLPPPPPPPAQTTDSRSVQVQVLSTQSSTGANANAPGSTNNGLPTVASIASVHPSSMLSSTTGGDNSLAQLAQLGALRLPPDQQQRILLATQLQHLKSSSGANANTILLQSGGLQGIVVTTAPPTSSSAVKGSGLFVSPYPPDTLPAQTAGSIVTQPGMMGLQQPGIQTTSYYDPQTLQHVGIHSEPAHGGAGGVTHTTRAHPQTIQWLFENYETAEGVSLPRSTLYNHYLRHCAANKIDAVNAASFGKLIRSVYVGLKTRRLGTRGNSKYHYYGIRIKPDSPLNTFPTDETPAVAMRQSSQSTQREFAGGESTPDGVEGSAELTPQQQHQQYLGDCRPELVTFPEIQWDGTPIPGALTNEDLQDFTALYREHCEAILDVVVNLQFQMVENLWSSFWCEMQKSAIGDSLDDEGEQQIPRDKLLLLVSCQPVVDYINACDHTLYQCIVDFLVPDVLRPIPGTLTQAIRNFAKSLESWLSASLQGFSATMVKSKICSVVAFAQTLRRYTSLNHLAQAARAVLQNSSQISQMLSDLNRVDFANVQEQASWVCECEESLVLRLEQDFKTTLQQQHSLEQWASWLESVVTTILEPYEGGERFTSAARQFLLKWSFYSSMVIRDLTLRSAASFGSFHLIRLLYDEYMFFLIEHKVAKATGRTPIAVMSEFSGHSRRIMSSGEGVAIAEVDLDLKAPTSDEPPAKRQKL